MTSRRKTHLLDVNVLVSLAWPNHVHHVTAVKWFGSRPATQAWATTPITESGFVRVSSNHHAIPNPVSPSEAIAALESIRAVRGHVFLPDTVENVIGVPPAVAPDRVVTHRLVTDAHLLAIADHHDATLVTFDRGIPSLTDVAGLVHVID